MAHVPTSERRIQLIEAASRVIGREGVGGATTRAIAREAGVPQATIHYVFGSKEQLFFELLRWAITITDSLLDENRVPAKSGVQRAVTELLAGYYAVDRDFLYSFVDLILWSMRTEIARDEAALLYERLHAQISTSLARAAADDERGIDTDYLAKLALIACDGVQIGKLCVGDRYVDDSDVERIAGALVMLASTSRATSNP